MCDQDGYASSAIFINYFYSIYPEWTKEHISYVHHEGKQHGLCDTYDISISRYHLVYIKKKSSAEPTRDTKNRYSITSTYEVLIEEV